MKIKSGLGIESKNTGFSCKNCKGYGQFTRSKRITRNICGDDTKFFKNAWVETCSACSGSGCWRPPVPGVFYRDKQQARLGDVCDYFGEYMLISYSPEKSEFITKRDDRDESSLSDFQDDNIIIELIYLGNIYSTQIDGDEEGVAFNFCNTPDFKQFQQEYQTKIKLWEE